MIKNMRLEGFKCFHNEQFTLADMTLLSGLNSSGKSTFIQAVRMLREKKLLEGLGKSVELVSSLCRRGIIVCNEDRSGGYAARMLLSRKGFKFEKVEGSDFCDRFAYISASRLGQEIQLPVSMDSELESVGERGEYVLDFIHRHSELAGVPELLQRNEGVSSVLRNVAAWLEVISPGVVFDYEMIPSMDRGRAIYSERRPTNVGFGLAYSLPIIANVLVYAALFNEDVICDPIIMIENPEAHLHPAGQTAMGRFLALAASVGVQIIVETHSDHLLNGIRLAVKDGELDRNDTAFYFFRYDFDAEKTEVENPIIDSNGFFDEWPDGFFDEAEKSLARLL